MHLSTSRIQLPMYSILWVLWQDKVILSHEHVLLKQEKAFSGSNDSAGMGQDRHGHTVDSKKDLKLLLSHILAAIAPVSFINRSSLELCFRTGFAAAGQPRQQSMLIFNRYCIEAHLPQCICGLDGKFNQCNRLIILNECCSVRKIEKGGSKLGREPVGICPFVSFCYPESSFGFG